MKLTRITFATLLVLVGLLANCTYAIPIGGAVRARSLSQKTGIKHSSRLGANIALGVALDSMVGFLLVVRAYQRGQ